MSAADLLMAARSAGLRIAVAESCTGGLLAAAITAPAGASDIFELGVVTYSNQSKVALLGVRRETIDAHGAVSEEVAREMAEGVRARAGAGLAVAVTGVAGPGGSERKPEGRVCFGLAALGGTVAETVEFGAPGRAAVRARSVEHALSLLLRAVQRGA